jgi:hypothetical protein
MSSTLHEKINRWLKTVALCLTILHSAGPHTEATTPALTSVFRSVAGHGSAGRPTGGEGVGHRFDTLFDEASTMQK